MTPSTRRTVALAITLLATSATATAHATLLPAAGPWPAPVSGATNPLIGTPFVFNGGHATPNASLRAWLPAGRSRRTDTTRTIGASTIVRGRLRNRDSGRSISGATVELAAQDVTAADWLLVGPARTNRKGEFRVVLPPGLTRRVAVTYWPTVSAASPVYSRRLLVRAKARVDLTTTMRGRSILYRGHVSGALIPAGGLVVAAQIANGRGWVTVRLVRTQPSGRFVARYRFNSSGRTFRVRALAPSQPAWPLYSGYSQTRRARPR